MIKSTNDLKDTFATGNQANEDAFADLIDSAYNKSDDSVLLGPEGVTGTYGLIGPTGGTHYGLIPSEEGSFIGLYLSSKGSTSVLPNTVGATGETVLYDDGGADAYLYIHNGSQWLRFSGTNDW
jgi:hypothetical protein